MRRLCCAARCVFWLVSSNIVRLSVRLYEGDLAVLIKAIEKMEKGMDEFRSELTAIATELQVLSTAQRSEARYLRQDHLCLAKLTVVCSGVTSNFGPPARKPIGPSSFLSRRPGLSCSRGGLPLVTRFWLANVGAAYRICMTTRVSLEGESR